MNKSDTIADHSIPDVVEALGCFLEARYQLGDDVGDGPDLVHPTDDLPDRHRDGRRIGRLTHPLVCLTDEDVLQRHRERLRCVGCIPRVRPPTLQEPRGLAGVDPAPDRVA